jgi:hypothetical protein
VRRCFTLCVLAACSRDPASTPAKKEPAAAAPAPGACAIEKRAIDRPAPERLVAIGDVHGDLEATRRVLRLAGAIDASDRWIGGTLAIVQTGDILDRGDDEQAILDLFERLEREAAAAGGSFTWLLGNHELMNANGDFRYVTDGGWRDFPDRKADLAPGGTYAKVMSGQDVVVKVGDTVFSHAGVVPERVTDLAALNRGARCWLAGAGSTPEVAEDDEGVVWTRAWGGDEVDCGRLRAALEALGAKRMVVGHTPQLGGVTSACDGALWRIDVGLAAHYGGPTEALEITSAGARVLR